MSYCFSYMGQIKKIAIIGNFPAWLVSKDIPVRKGHYPVWLMPLYDSFQHCTDYEIHWLTLSRNIKSPFRFVSKNQYFHVLPCGSRTIGLYTMYISDRVRMFKELSRISPDLVHSWGTENSFGLCAYDYRKHAKWLHSVQGLLKTYMKLGSMSRFHRHQSMYEPKVLRGADYITTESPWAAVKVREMIPDANPIVWDYAVESRFFLAERNLTETPSCLYCGSDAAIKNLQTLINVFSKPELKHVKLILAGPSPALFSELPPNIQVLGRISRDEVMQLMTKSWCLVHPSLADTGPTAAKEARVMGIPVVISSHCGAQQYVKEGLSGFITEPMDEVSIATAILKIVESKRTTLSMGAYDQERCRRALSADTMYTSLMQIYESLL